MDWSYKSFSERYLNEILRHKLQLYCTALERMFISTMQGGALE